MDQELRNANYNLGFKEWKTIKCLTEDDKDGDCIYAIPNFKRKFSYKVNWQIYKRC